ncbi:hypothetical protein [Cytobacillus citreus]|nr:hypothetical protein [Cytobacillus citreus]
MKKESNPSFKKSYESDNKMGDSKKIQDKKKDDTEIFFNSTQNSE